MATSSNGVTIPTLLGTKLHVPATRRGIVRRARLVDRLVTGDLPSLVLVSAPAGFGKTTLLADWLAHRAGDDLAAGWLSLDARDNDPALFCAYLVAAVRTAEPAVGDAALAILQSSPSSMEQAMTALLNDLAGVDRPVVLVLDDFHVIESAELHALVAFLLDNLPPHLHLVIASRADPPLLLGRLRARGELVEVRAAELRFTVDEATTYLTESVGLDLTAHDVEVLDARTEGWAAALQLAGLSMQGRDDLAGFIATFAGDDRFVVDYLLEEVLERQTDDVRDFLLHTSILSRVTGSLCDAVTGRSDGSATLESLDRANLFLVPLDDRRIWYRYHHLFGDVLRARLLGAEPERIDELHRRASDWHAEHGEPADAVAHAIAGHHHERAAELIELAAPALRRARQEATLRQWLEVLPRTVFEPRPVLTMALVGARMSTGALDGVESLLDSVERWLPPAPADGSTTGMVVADHDELRRLPAQAAVQRAGLALMAGDTPGTIAHANRALDLLVADDGLVQGAAAALVGLATWRRGDLEGARSSYADAVTTFVRAGFLADALGCSIALADLQLALGRLTDATRTYEAGLALAVAHAPLRGTADMHVGLGELLRERNQLEAALGHLHTAEQLGEHAGLPQNPYRWRVAAARIRQATGDLAGALALLDQAGLVHDTDYSPDVRPIGAMRARLQLAQGDLASATAWVRERGLTADDELTYVREYDHLTLARTLLAGGAEGRSALMGLLERLLGAADRGGRTGSVIEILVLQALAHQARTDRRAALASVEQALTLAQPEGYVRLFLDEGPAMAMLLGAAAAQGVAADHSRRLLAELDARPPASNRQVLVDELSSRELDVLRLLRSELSGPEIARQLLVSLNTMRTHTRNIYAKLGVSNRREAVRRASELGL